MKSKTEGKVLEIQSDANGVRFPVGTVVGAHRWPYDSAHPDCWGTPWKGVVLAFNDRRVWAGNPALSTQDKIDTHVAWCQVHGLFKDSVPVLWDFGDKQIVYFQTAVGDGRCHDLRTYAEDYLEWQVTRSAACRTKVTRDVVNESSLKTST